MLEPSLKDSKSLASGFCCVLSIDFLSTIGIASHLHVQLKTKYKTRPIEKWNNADENMKSFVEKRMAQKNDQATLVSSAQWEI